MYQYFVLFLHSTIHQVFLFKIFDNHHVNLGNYHRYILGTGRSRCVMVIMRFLRQIRQSEF